METLFYITPRYPNGFSYRDNFLTEEEERKVLSLISEVEFHTFVFQGYTAKRRVKSFGFDYSFSNRTIKKDEDIPAKFDWLISKVAAHTGVANNAFKELLITEYPEGAVINWHRDAPPFDLIAGISLMSDCTFKLRPYQKEKQSRSTTFSLAVNRRSLYVISGESRTDWEHSIVPVAKVRYSITLRTLR